jgi:uncharacterized protein YndB with AHSA1/START domain
MTNQTKKMDGLMIVRDFKAPSTKVFQAFSAAEGFADWWGPAGMPLSIKRFEFRKGGTLHYKMEGGGNTMWGLFKYANIVSPDLIEFVNSFSDEEGNICKAPFPMEFPLEIFNRITLRENSGITTLTFESHPLNATPEQEATFHSMINNISGGFAGTFSQLEAYLTKKQNKN